jgi:hypothetical protein
MYKNNGKKIWRLAMGVIWKEDVDKVYNVKILKCKSVYLNTNAILEHIHEVRGTKIICTSWFGEGNCEVCNGAREVFGQIKNKSYKFYELKSLEVKLARMEGDDIAFLPVHVKEGGINGFWQIPEYIEDIVIDLPVGSEMKVKFDHAGMAKVLDVKTATRSQKYGKLNDELPYLYGDDPEVKQLFNSSIVWHRMPIFRKNDWVIV